MALDFPTSPTNGQVYGNYTYDSTAGAWRSSALYDLGIPLGGAANTVLMKNTSTNYDDSWGLITTSNISGSAGITNAQLANSAITINGTSVSLGGTRTVTASQITSGTLPLAQGGTGNTLGAGLNPIVPSSVAVGSGSSSVSTSGLVTFTGSSSVSLNTVFSSTYRNYRLVIDIPTVSGTGGLTVRFRTGTTDNSNNLYFQYWFMNRLNGTTTLNTGGPNTAYSLLSFVTNTNSFPAYSGDIFAPYINGQTSINGIGIGSDATSSYHLMSTVLYNAAASFDGITIYSSVNMTGTIQILGYRN